MTIRTKLILALLVCSLASVALVGGVAYYKLTRKFNDLMMQDSFARFEQDAQAYRHTYGSWQAARNAEPFGAFVQRRAAANGQMPHAVGLAPAERPRGPMPPPDFAEGDGPPPNMPPPPRDEVKVRPLPRSARNQQPPPPANDINRPPYRFALFDRTKHAVLATPPYQVDDPMRAEDQERVLPITDKGRVVGYALPVGVATLSALDMGYLAAMREALSAGLLVATLLALTLGVFFGTTLSRALRRLTAATQAVSEGSLGLQVPGDGRDEVGILARAFNGMSAELRRQHEELMESNQKIREQADHLRELSIRDALTQLYNRRHFDEYVARMHAEAVRYEHPLTVMIGDIDFFKRINDSYSHAMGDAVLRQVAEILNRNTRMSDLLARYGGEEFVIAFPETALPQAVELCEKLRRAIENHPWQDLHPELKVSMSIGLSANLHLGDAEAMLREADGLLYEAKAGGRNQVRHSPAHATA